MEGNQAARAHLFHGDGEQQGACLQRQDLQPGGYQAGDDWLRPGRVLHYLQAGEARLAWHRGHPLLPLHPSVTDVFSQ